MLHHLRHFWNAAVSDPHYSQGSVAAAAAGVATAAGVETQILGDMPKGWLVGVVLMMFAGISFFVKRDWARVTGHQEKTDATLARIEAKLSATVTHESLGVSMGRVHEKINAHTERTVAIEAHLGLYRPTPSAEDKTKAG